MKVYRICPDPQYSSFILDLSERGLSLDGHPQMETWITPAVSVDDSDRPGGDIWYAHSGALASGPDAPAFVEGFFEMAGEKLRISYNGCLFTLLNVTECIDCLDAQRVQWALDDNTRRRHHLAVYAFHQERFSESSLFKIPETCEHEILVVERWVDPDEEFKCAIESAGLKGILFEEIWDSDAV